MVTCRRHPLTTAGESVGNAPSVEHETVHRITVLAPLPEEDDGEGADIVDAGDVSMVRDADCVWMGIYEGTGSVAAKLAKESLRRLVMSSVHESGGNMHRYVRVGAGVCRA